jgi:hypothetical protein
MVYLIRILYIRTLLRGILEVTPMQALHLPESKQHMLVRVCYGEQRHSTFRMPPASYLTWYQETGANTNNNPAQEGLEGVGGFALPPQRDNSQNASLAKCFDIDTTQIRGALVVRVMTEGLTKAQVRVE